MYVHRDGSSPLARGTQTTLAREIARGRFIPAGAGNTHGIRTLPTAVPVHPRWRGEHAVMRTSCIEAGGSSPLARGTHRVIPWLSLLARFIPAGAGNTPGRTRPCCPCTVHPRWRGEHGCWVAPPRPCSGSSPLARGTRNAVATDLRPQDGSSPLARGTRLLPSVPRSCPSVHPRWRGEHPAPRREAGYTSGSSPLARGTHWTRSDSCAAGRFIPAGAGNTGWSRPNQFFLPVHPRWRGEHPLSSLCGMTSAGSSPLARGTRLADIEFTADLRFIPAGAGNTGGVAHCLRLHPVHPRWRGEHATGLLIIVRSLRFIPAGAGNTCRTDQPGAARPVHPRWRGEHARCDVHVCAVSGSSPLARGTPSRPRSAGSPHAVHPRWRGEHPPWRCSPPLGAGSSPLARGTHVADAPNAEGARFIPAGAGNTRSANPSASLATVHPRWRGEHVFPVCRNDFTGGSSPLARGTP